LNAGGTTDILGYSQPRSSFIATAAKYTLASGDGIPDKYGIAGRSEQGAVLRFKLFNFVVTRCGQPML
jgi:hypothetical protein